MLKITAWDEAGKSAAVWPRLASTNVVGLGVMPRGETGLVCGGGWGVPREKRKWRKRTIALVCLFGVALLVLSGRYEDPVVWVCLALCGMTLPLGDSGKDPDILY